MRDRRQQLAGDADDARAVRADDGQRCRPPRVQGGVRSGRDRDVDGERDRQLAHHVERIRQAGGHRRGSRLLGKRVTEEQRADVPALRRDARIQLLERRVVGPGGADRDEVRAVDDTGLRQEHRGDLEEGEVRHPARQIAAGDLDESGQHRAAQQPVLRVERVGELHGGSLRVEQRNHCGRAERIGEHLRRSRGRERRGRTSASRLRSGEAAPGRGDRQHRGDAVVADDAGDLLDEGERVCQVGTPRGRRDRPAIAAE